MLRQFDSATAGGVTNKIAAAFGPFGQHPTLAGSTIDCQGVTSRAVGMAVDHAANIVTAEGGSDRWGTDVLDFLWFALLLALAAGAQLFDAGAAFGK